MTGPPPVATITEVDQPAPQGGRQPAIGRGMSSDQLTGEVQKPARYAGGEWNQVVKTDERVRCRMALCYPDAYEVGMSHLGSRILYEVANRRPDTACERAFLPWPDMAEDLQHRGALLSTLETGTPLRALDLVGITLQHELNYPGIVRMLELGGIPAWASERTDDHPLVIGGGPGAASPEPVAPFFDALVIGDGEEALGEVIDVCIASRSSARSRKGILEALAGIEGVYVPALYEPDEGGLPRPLEGAPQRVRRRVVADLDTAPFPARPVVPFVEIVHDRAQLEINRGCTHGCRFCQAGILYRPTRQRSLETLRGQARAILESTGYEQISLSSLSCTDYPRIVELVDAIAEDFGDKRVSVALPSLRTDQFGVELAARVSRAKKSSITLAPEAGSQRLRDVINKNVTEENLRLAVTAAFAGGWHSVKVYYMVGLPTETDDDIRAIADTLREVAAIGRQELGKRRSRLRIPVTISGFVPKPHSVFESRPQCSRRELGRKHDLLRGLVKDRAVHLRFSSPDQSALEGVLGRGDRGMAEVIYRVAQDGPGLESWNEWFSLDRWKRAFAESGTTLDGELARVVENAETGPWGHIDTGVTAAFRRREVARCLEARTTPDCRTGGCNVCGLEDCCALASGAPHETPTPPAAPPPRIKTDDRAPTHRAIVTFSKGESVRFVSHLDVSRALQRAARRAGLPLAYTQGFNQRPRMTIAQPLPVGMTGGGELWAMELTDPVDPKEAARALKAQMPEGLGFESIAVGPRLGKSPFAKITHAEYDVHLAGVAREELAAALEQVMNQAETRVMRTTKRSERDVDIRPGILAAQVAAEDLGLEMDIACSDAELVKPAEVVEALNRALAERGAGGVQVERIHRRRLLTDD